MPKLPSVADQPRPTPRPASGVVSYNLGALKQRELPGIAKARVGGEIADTAMQFERVLQAEQERKDRVSAEDALNRLREHQLDLTIGEKNGFMQKKGGDAVNQPILQDYVQRLDEGATGIAEKLGNDRQRELFRPRAAVAALQFKEDILKHVARENSAYAEQVFKGTIDTEIRNATTRWDDPPAIGLSLARINDAINTEARRAGWAPEIIEAQRLAATGKLHTHILGQALATENYEYAKRYFDANKESIPPETARIVQRQVQDGTEKQVSAGYRRDFINLRDDAKGLDKLMKRVTVDPVLDTDQGRDRQNILLGQIASRIETLQNRDRMVYDQNMKMLERAINKLNARTLSGYEPSLEQFAPYLAAAQGTELEAEVKNAIQLAAATRDFRLSTPARQEGMLNDIEARARTNPESVDPTILGHLKTIHERQVTEIHKDPVGFAYHQGLATPVVVDWSQPAMQADKVIARINTARAMNQVYGAEIKPLLPDELNAIRSRLENAKPEDKMAWFGNLRMSAGGDPTGYSAMMAQLAPDDPAMAMAGEFAGKGRTEPARLILEGQALLHPPRKADGSPDQGKLWPMPADTDIRKRFQSLEEGAFAGNAKYRNAAEQATKAIYAKLSEEAGDNSGVVNNSRYKEAFNLATGGVVTYNSRDTFLPYGMEPSDFRKGIKRRVEEIVRTDRLAQGMTADKLHDMPLDAIGDGRYVFRSGNGFLVDKNGQRIILNFNLEPPEPAKPKQPRRGWMSRGGEPTFPPDEAPE